MGTASTVNVPVKAPREAVVYSRPMALSSVSACRARKLQLEDLHADAHQYTSPALQKTLLLHSCLLFFSKC